VSEQVNDDENLNSTTHLLVYFTPCHFQGGFFLGVRDCDSEEKQKAREKERKSLSGDLKRKECWPLKPGKIEFQFFN